MSDAWMLVAQLGTRDSTPVEQRLRLRDPALTSIVVPRLLSVIA